MASKLTASAPVMSCRGSVCEMPQLMNAPKPPAPMYVAIAVMPMLVAAMSNRVEAPYGTP